MHNKPAHTYLARLRQTRLIAYKATPSLPSHLPETPPSLIVAPDLAFLEAFMRGGYAEAPTMSLPVVVHPSSHRDTQKVQRVWLRLNAENPHALVEKGNRYVSVRRVPEEVSPCERL